MMEKITFVLTWSSQGTIRKCHTLHLENSMLPTASGKQVHWSPGHIPNLQGFCWIPQIEFCSPHFSVFMGAKSMGIGQYEYFSSTHIYSYLESLLCLSAMGITIMATNAAAWLLTSYLPSILGWICVFLPWRILRRKSSSVMLMMMGDMMQWGQGLDSDQRYSN